MSDANSGRGTAQAQPESNVTTLVNGFGQVPSSARATYGPIPGADRDETASGPASSDILRSDPANSDAVAGDGRPAENGNLPLQAPVWEAPAPKPAKQSWREKLGLGKKEAAEVAPGPAAVRLAGAQQVSATREVDAPADQVPGPDLAIPPPTLTRPSTDSTPGPAVSASTAAGSAAKVSEAGPAPRPSPVAAPLVPPPFIAVTDRADETQRPGPATTDGPSTTVIPAVAFPVAGAVMAKPDEPTPVTAPRPKPGTPRRTRKARLRLSRLDPWSVMKTSFMFSIAAGIMLVVAVYVVWTVLGTSGLFDSVNGVVADVLSAPNDTTPFRIQDYVNTQKVMGVSALIACVDVVIFTALATLASFLYNLAATMLGGLEITLAED